LFLPTKNKVIESIKTDLESQFLDRRSSEGDSFEGVKRVAVVRLCFGASQNSLLDGDLHRPDLSHGQEAHDRHSQHQGQQFGCHRRAHCEQECLWLWIWIAPCTAAQR